MTLHGHRDGGHRRAGDGAAPETRTISDFGRQWTVYTENEGFYGSQKMFRDILEPLLSPGDLEGAAVAEIGSGTGRIVAMLLRAGARTILAVEPSAAYDVLERNVAALPGAAGRVRSVRVRGQELRAERPLDFVFAIGSLHHVPDPEPVVRAAFKALAPGGRLFVWLYAREGNEAYLRWILPLRRVTRRLPHGWLRLATWALYLPLVAYRQATRVLPLPLAGYLANVLWPMSPAHRRLVIYDQLNPYHARYYRRQEAESLLLDQGFVDVRLHHRHGYSWSVIGTRPETTEPRAGEIPR